MSPPTDATHEALLEVIRTLSEGMQTEREAHRKQLARLTAMVEGLTKQLDLLLKERDEERRAELARLRAEAAAALASVATSETACTEGGDEAIPGDEDGDEAPEAPPPKPPKNRHEHGRGAKPTHLPRDVTTIKPDQCTTCGGDNLLVGDVLVGEEYDFVRAYLRIRRTERTTCTCKDCNAHIVPEQPPSDPSAKLGGPRAANR